MKNPLHLIILLSVLVLMSMKSNQQEITLECVKRHHASNSCHYNFMIDGEKYRYIDSGCKAKRDDIVKKAKDGKLALAKDWRIECQIKKPK